MNVSSLLTLSCPGRAAGKTLAVANTVWLLLSTVFEYVGFYNKCWCKSCFANLGHQGWVVLFKTDLDFRRVAQGPWRDGIIMSTMVVVVLLLFFAMGTKWRK
jgi:hypothetical protein